MKLTKRSLSVMGFLMLVCVAFLLVVPQAFSHDIPDNAEVVLQTENVTVYRVPKEGEPPADNNMDPKDMDPKAKAKIKVLQCMTLDGAGVMPWFDASTNAYAHHHVLFEIKGKSDWVKVKFNISGPENYGYSNGYDTYCAPGYWYTYCYYDQHFAYGLYTAKIKVKPWTNRKYGAQSCRCRFRYN